MKKIIISMGDPAGIGPEIIVKFFNDLYNKESDNNIIYAVCGTKKILEYYIKLLELELKIITVTEDTIQNNNIYEKNTILLFNTELNSGNIDIGEISKEAGELTMRYLTKAVELVEKGIFDALVTAPISKDSINKAGYKYSGHTSFLADRYNTTDFAMILKGDKITVLLNSTHLSLKDAIEKVTIDNIYDKIILADKAKKIIGLSGKIAVAGLNPHNGENGLFGNEEHTTIEPAVNKAIKEGVLVEGPIVPDTLFVKILQGKYEIAVVMYHDQGLIPMKMESFGQGVNITIGLPIIRTSVDHGTAFDIAGRGIANFGSLKEAIKMAEKIIKNQINNLK